MHPFKTFAVPFVSLLLYLSLAASASAYEWTIEGEDLPSLGISKEMISGSGGAFTLTVPTLGIEIKCSTTSSAGEIVEGGSSAYSMSLTGCKLVTWEGVCSVNSPGKSAGTLSSSIAATVVAGEIGKAMKAYDVITPKMTVIFLGEECPYTEINGEISGKIPAEVPKPGEESKERTQKYSKEVEKDAGSSLLFGGTSKASMSGEITETLSGANKGKPQKVQAVKVTPPAPVAFAGVGPGNARQIMIKNVGDLKVKLTNLEIFLGPYTLTEPAPPCKGKELVKNATCTTTIECNIAMSGGVFWVKWDELNAAGNVVGFDGHLHRLSC